MFDCDVVVLFLKKMMVYVSFFCVMLNHIPPLVETELNISFGP